MLLALADQANDAGVAWPAQGSLARRARQTDRNVRRMLVKLERMGLLSVERRSSSHGRKSNRYRLHVGARIGESLESRQPDNRSGCGRPADGRPADDSLDSSVSVGISATGQSVRLRKRTDCPVAQPDTDVLPQPDTDVRLPPITNHHMNHQTGPDQDQAGGVKAGRARASIGSGQDGDVDGQGLSSQTGDGSRQSGCEPVSSSAASVPEADRLVVGECLPEQMRVLDAAGARRVVGLLRERLEAGWRPEQIRSVMDQSLPSRVGRLSSLVAKRLELNVVPGMAPLGSAEVVRRSEAEVAERRERRSMELAASSPEAGQGADPVWSRALAEAGRRLPGGSRLERALLARSLIAGG